MPEEDIIEPEVKKPKPKAKATETKTAAKLKPRIDFDEPVKNIDYTGNFKNDIAGGKKIINKGDTTEKIERNIAEFAIDSSRRAVATVQKAHEEEIKTLLANTYYPTKRVQVEVKEPDKVKHLVNLV